LATFPINFFLKFVPDEICLTMGDEPAEDVEASKKDYEDLLNIAKKYKFRDNSNSQRFIENKQGGSFKGRN